MFEFSMRPISTGPIMAAPKSKAAQKKSKEDRLCSQQKESSPPSQHKDEA
ncbi:MAG: hypothetical protein JWO28_2642 [Hyphomicrobiales bacterium]|nr:hypothetical protein [Hyphomicrobiales bacterium]